MSVMMRAGRDCRMMQFAMLSGQQRRHQGDPEECAQEESGKPASHSYMFGRAGKEKAYPGCRTGLYGNQSRLDAHLHEFHELIFGVVHHLRRDRRNAALFGQPLDFLAGHRADKVGDIVEPLLRFTRPGNAVG